MKNLLLMALLFSVPTTPLNACVLNLCDEYCFTDSFSAPLLSSFWELSGENPAAEVVTDPCGDGLHGSCMAVITGAAFHQFASICKGVISFDMFVYHNAPHITFANSQTSAPGSQCFFDFHPTHGNLFGADIPNYGHTPTSMEIDKPYLWPQMMPNPEDYTPLRWDTVDHRWYTLQLFFDNEYTGFYVNGTSLYSAPVGSGFDSISFEPQSRYPLYIDNFACNLSPIPELPPLPLFATGLIMLLAYRSKR